MTKADVINKENKLTEKAIKAFTEIFLLFSKEGKMYPEDCASFTQMCCSKVYSFIVS